MRKYLVVHERADDGGWGAYLPDVGGVVALGASREEVAKRIHEALDTYAAEMASLARSLPEPRDFGHGPRGLSALVGRGGGSGLRERFARPGERRAP